MGNEEIKGAPDWLAGALLLVTPAILTAVDMAKNPETVKMVLDGDFLTGLGLTGLALVGVFHNLAGQTRRMSGK